MLPFSAGQFDLVVATMSLHHCVDAATLAGEIARVLVPKGVLLLREHDATGGCMAPTAGTVKAGKTGTGAIKSEYTVKGQDNESFIAPANASDFAVRVGTRAASGTGTGTGTGWTSNAAASATEEQHEEELPGVDMLASLCDLWHAMHVKVWWPTGVALAREMHRQSYATTQNVWE